MNLKTGLFVSLLAVAMAGCKSNNNQATATPSGETASSVNTASGPVAGQGIETGETASSATGTAPLGQTKTGSKGDKKTGQ